MKRFVYFMFVLFIVSAFIFCGEKSSTVDESSDLVKPPEWFANLPRPIYAQLERVETADWWFEVYKLPSDVIAIYEPYQFEEAISYLVIGADRAILIDTGTGIGDLKKTVDELTDLPVTVVNTHAHYDHIGNNWQFGETAVFNNAEEINRLLTGHDNASLQRHLVPELVPKGLPDYFDPAMWTIPPSEPDYLLEDGSVVDLGGRMLEVIHTPGHSPGEICLLDRENRLLFTGDMFFPGPLYAFGDDVSIDDYAASFDKLNARIDEYDYLLSGHNDPWVNSEVIPRVVDAFGSVLSGGGKYDEKSGVRRYYFDGFDILIRPDMVK